MRALERFVGSDAYSYGFLIVEGDYLNGDWDVIVFECDKPA